MLVKRRGQERRKVNTRVPVDSTLLAVGGVLNAAAARAQNGALAFGCVSASASGTGGVPATASQPASKQGRFRVCTPNTIERLWLTTARARRRVRSARGRRRARPLSRALERGVSRVSSSSAKGRTWLCTRTHTRSSVSAVWGRARKTRPSATHRAPAISRRDSRAKKARGTPQRKPVRCKRSNAPPLAS